MKISSYSFAKHIVILTLIKELYHPSVFRSF